MLSQMQKHETYKVLGLAAMSSTSSKHKISWAMTLLEQGVEAENLSILATLSNPVNEFEADDYFDRTLRELGIEMPSYDCALEGYAKALATDVVNGVLSPEEGASKLYGIKVKLENSEPLAEYSVLDDESFCELNGWSKQKRKDEIIKACKETIRQFNYPKVFKA